MNKLNLFYVHELERIFLKKVAPTEKLISYVGVWFHREIGRHLIEGEDSFKRFMGDCYTKPFELPSQTQVIKIGLQFDDALLRIDLEVLDGAYSEKYVKVTEVRVVEEQK